MNLRSWTNGEFVRRGLICLFVAAVFIGGIQLRAWTWKKTAPLRFAYDMANSFQWGNETLAEARRRAPDETTANSWPGFLRGYFALYDRVTRESPDGQYRLDYPPLRLLVVSIWAKQLQQKFPDRKEVRPGDVRPMRRLNLFCEAVSAVAIFLLVRLWVKRASGKTGSRFMHRVSPQDRAWICGLAGATVAWLNLSMILDAHGWPQWDVWILPFYLFAALAASTNRWFWCGCLLALGAMLKGQLLLVTPFFFLWPLWQRKWTRALRMLSGFAFATAAVVSPWLLRDPKAWGIVAVVLCASASGFYRWRTRYAGAWFTGTIALSVFAAGALAGGSFSWLQVGFLYGLEHHQRLSIDPCYNLPWLLSNLGWTLKNPHWAVDIGRLHLALNPQWALRILYSISLALCALGAARHARKRDPRLLIALAAPWLVMFALLGQMHERYLMWGGVVSALALGVSLRMTLIHFILSAISTAMIAHAMLINKLAPPLPAIAVFDRVQPYASWVVLVCSGFFFWETLSNRVPMLRRSRHRPREVTSLALGETPEQA